MNRRWLGLAFAVVTLAFSAAVYNRLPEQVPTHFDMAGNPDDYTARPYAAVGMPIFALLLLLIFIVLPRISPRRANMERFEDTYWLVANSVVALMCALHVLILGRAMGWPVDITSATLLGIGVMFMIIGNVLPRMRSNWWMGIRTPWTMESEHVWHETHRLAGKTFMAGGAITIVGAMLPPDIRPWIALGALSIAGFVPVVYSYVVWRRDKAA